MVTTAFVNSVLLEQQLINHEMKKLQLMDELAMINASNGQIALQKNTSNLFRHRSANPSKIDVRGFNQVLAIDTENLTATVEGMTTYEDLVNACLPHLLLPAVVPELKSITVGGALSGGAIESSSFRYGLMHESVLEFEVLLSDGRIILCRPDNEHKDLFYGFPNTYGTLGYALKIKIKLIPVTRYVKLTNHHYTEQQLFLNDLKQFCETNRQASEEDDFDYIDSVIFDENNFHIITAKFIDKVIYLSNYKYMKPYYRSIPERQTDYLSTLDYIWRWDPDWFWCSKFFYMQNPVLRFIFGPFLLKSTAYWKIRSFMNKHHLTRALVEKMQAKTEAVIQDVQIPIENASEFLTFFEREIGIKPIWLCPTMPYNEQTNYSFYNLVPNKLYINFGFWDVVKSDKEEGFYNILVERKVRELGGYKGLYSSVYYNENDFWTLYDKEKYFALKQKYDPQHRFRNLYQKCSEK